MKSLTEITLGYEDTTQLNQPRVTLTARGFSFLLSFARYDKFLTKSILAKKKSSEMIK
jgi:hypothetical protein